jgi:hypothetical protein
VYIRYLYHLVGLHHWTAAGFAFVIRGSLQALPLPTSIRPSVVGFNLSPVLTLCLFDGSSEGIAKFLISIRISDSLLESGSSSLWLSADFACYPWCLVGICTYSHYGNNVMCLYVSCCLCVRGSPMQQASQRQGNWADLAYHGWQTQSLTLITCVLTGDKQTHTGLQQLFTDARSRQPKITMCTPFCIHFTIKKSITLSNQQLCVVLFGCKEMLQCS